MIREINIGGAVRPLSFNFNCLEEFEEMTGVNPLNGLESNIKTFRALLFCGLKYGLHPEGCDNSILDFNIKTVGSWLSAEDIARILQAYNSQGQPDEEKKTEQEAVIE